MKIPQSVKSTKYPEFIRNHEVFEKFPKIEKVFPRIGLDNCEGTIPKGLKKRAVGYLMGIVRQIEEHVKGCNNGTYYVEGALDDGEYKDVLTEIADLIKANPNSCIKHTKSNVKFVLPKDITLPGKYKCMVLKKGSDLIDTISSLEKMAYTGEDPFYGLSAKAFKKEVSNKKLKNTKIVFSSEGNKGLWDIATMSMRGISSCQKWGRTQSSALVGSMADPYAGIIYLTDNSNTKYGQKMIKRAVVRFVVSADHKREPTILVEKIYSDDDGAGTDMMTFNLFAEFLKEKTKNKFKVVYGDVNHDYDDLSYEYVIPFTEPVKFILDRNTPYTPGCPDPEDELSYRDSGIDYVNVRKFDKITKVRAI